MKCKYCDQDLPLIHSHIVPEFLYTSLYDSQHRFLILSNADKKPFSLKQKGIRENLFCETCDKKIGNYEDYVAKVFKGGVGLTMSDKNGLITIHDIDYAKMKLFTMSLVWRMSISSHEIFSNVKLGPHEDRLKQMITSENPGTIDDYSCVSFILYDKGELVKDLISMPEIVKSQGIRVCRFIAGALIWMIFISIHNKQYEGRKWFLGFDNKMFIRKANVTDFPFIVDMAKRIVNKR